MSVLGSDLLTLLTVLLTLLMHSTVAQPVQQAEHDMEQEPAYVGWTVPLLSTYVLQCKQYNEWCYALYTCCDPRHECISAAQGTPYRCRPSRFYVEAPAQPVAA